jgi:PAS domain S-box-containing protein
MSRRRICMSQGLDFADLFDRSPNPYMVLDRDLCYVAANAAYLRETGARLEQLLGRKVTDVYPNDPDNPNNDSAQLLTRSLQKVLRTGERDVLAFIPYRVPRDGVDGDSVRYWSATHTPLFDRSGQVAFVLQHTVDVTGLSSLRDSGLPLPPEQLTAGVLDRAARVQQANVDLQRARDELQLRADLDRQLIGIVSHDLRNPLNAIGIGLSLLKGASLDSQQRSVLDRMMRSFERAARLIRDFLDFTQARVSGSIPVTPQPTSIREIVRAVCEEIQAAYTDRACRTSHDGQDVGDWDPDRLAQLVGNLVSNAFQHSPPGGVVTVRTAQRGDAIELSVHNAGPPIAESDRARLFQPFTRGAGSVSSKQRSVGLGLFIVQAIVAAHHGSIDVASTAEAGTTFTVRLPYVTMGGSSSPE